MGDKLEEVEAVVAYLNEKFVTVEPTLQQKYLKLAKDQEQRMKHVREML